MLGNACCNSSRPLQLHVCCVTTTHQATTAVRASVVLRYVTACCGIVTLVAMLEVRYASLDTFQSYDGAMLVVDICLLLSLQQQDQCRTAGQRLCRIRGRCCHCWRNTFVFLYAGCGALHYYRQVHAASSVFALCCVCAPCSKCGLRCCCSFTIRGAHANVLTKGYGFAFLLQLCMHAQRIAA